MAALSGAWLVVALVQLLGWIGATVLGAGVGAVPRRRRTLLVGAFAGVAGLATLGSVALAGVLATNEWVWGAEKLLIAAPLGVAGSAIGALVVLRELRAARSGRPAEPVLVGALITAALGALLGVLAILLIGAEVTWPSVLGMVLVGLAGSGIAFAASTRRPRRVVASTSAFAGLAVVLLALFTVFGPTVGAAVAGTSHHLAAPPSDDGPTTSIADLRETGTGTGVHRFALEARHETITLPGGREYAALTFGSVPGPTLVVTEGELVEVTLTNRDVAGGVTLHWHGYDVPSGDDGVAGVSQDAVLPGESFVYRFVAEEVGTYWYHTHQDALEGIVRGLYGSLVVLPAGESDPGVLAPIHSMSGVTLIADREVLDASGPGDTRVRLANTDQSPRRVVLDADVRLLALDGRDLAEPAALPAGTSLRIPSGGRADLLVDASRPTTLRLERGGDAAIVFGGLSQPADLDFRGPEFDVLGAASGTVPSWATGPVDVNAQQVLERLIRIVDGLPRLADTINGAAFPAIQPIVVDEGDVVRVTIVNRGTETHPMHLHGHHMLVISRDGRAADGALWLDTVDVRPGETWVVEFLADNPGVWMDHCHNLEHAAAGMVMHLAYRGISSPFELGGAHGNDPE
jgi:FtsP/CotA-like multicopper oxidase with cupredoxin domain